MTPAWLPDTVTQDASRMVREALLWGYEGIELRTVGSARVPHISESVLRNRLFEAEMDVVAVSPGLFEGPADDRAGWMNDLSILAETLPFCSRFRSRIILVSGFSETADSAHEALRRGGSLAERAGCTLAVLNEQGMAHETGEALSALLRTVDHPAVRAAWQPAEAFRAGGSTLAGTEALADRMSLVRFTDLDAAMLPVAPGEGAMEWSLVLAELLNVKFEGPVSMVLPPGCPRDVALAWSSALVGLLRAAKQ